MRRPEIEGGDLGGWAIKCDPFNIYDLTDPASGLWNQRLQQPVDLDVEWSLGRTYRAAAVAPGDRCFFWVSGDVSSTWVSGIWGDCKVTGTARNGRGGGPWIDGVKKRQKVPYLPVRIGFLPRPIPKTVVRSPPGLIMSELVRTPNRTNPVALTVDEVAEIDRLIQDL